MRREPASPELAADGLPPLRLVAERHGLFARKSLGQHFLFDLNLTRRIADAAGDLSTGTTIEVGPGPGGLTRGLLAAGAAHVIAIERDERFVPVLAEIAAAYPGRLEVMTADAMKVAVHALGATPRRVVANLPYNVGTPLLIDWLEHPEDFVGLTVMLQKEVVERVVAAPGTDAYGRLAVAAQWHWTARRVFDVPAGAFVPPPKVASAILRLEPRAEPVAPAPRAMLGRVVAAAFGQRRKMLRSALRALGGDPLAPLAAAGIDPTARAETLPVTAFCALARAYAARAASGCGATGPREAP
ncbi:MAG: 16S rRNA (adenine(1518)-N(6)/adenine(1519)-N(6))-dimethyltransferase RsmA [Alphaproteobacteria bacterium]|nr:16S rRNA (adenine(1518)-N(6)/adenine(1519)-N(6))-dimethyltransferase RsmA [Alphaproteobacteria bacterium]